MPGRPRRRRFMAWRGHGPIPLGCQPFSLRTSSTMKAALPVVWASRNFLLAPKPPRPPPMSMVSGSGLWREADGGEVRHAVGADGAGATRRWPQGRRAQRR